MVLMDWRDRITVDPTVCHGKACIRGTRVMVSVILDNLAAGETADAVARAFRIELDDIMAALHYAVEASGGRPPPTAA